MRVKWKMGTCHLWVIFTFVALWLLCLFFGHKNPERTEKNIFSEKGETI